MNSMGAEPVAMPTLVGPVIPPETLVLRWVGTLLCVGMGAVVGGLLGAIVGIVTGLIPFVC